MVALALAADLEARLGRDLTDAETLRANALLLDASAKVSRYTRQDFLPVADDVVILRGVDGEIRLPQRPVQSVSSVVAMGGNFLPNLTLFDWLWDGLDLIVLGPGNFVINLPEIWWDEDGYPDTYQVTYTHGYATVPDTVVAVICAMVMRTISAPTMSGGVSAETLGPYSYQLSAPSLGIAVTMTQADKDDLKDYRRPYGQTRIRPGV